MKSSHNVTAAVEVYYCLLYWLLVYILIVTMLQVDSHTAGMTQTHRDKQLSDGVVCKHLLVCEGDFERTVLLGPLLWPVLLTLFLSTLHSVGYHGNHMDLFLPHHPPEVSDSLWERACGKSRTPRAKELRCTSYVAYLEWQCTFCLVSNPECQI